MAERRKYTKELAVAFSLAALAGCSSLEERNPAGDGPSEQNPTKAKTSTPASPTETSTPAPTRTPTPTLTPTPTPDWRATNEARMIQHIEGESFSLSNVQVDRVIVVNPLGVKELIYGAITNEDGEAEFIVENFDCQFRELREDERLGNFVGRGGLPFNWRAWDISEVTFHELQVTKNTDIPGTDIGVFTSEAFRLTEGGNEIVCPEDPVLRPVTEEGKELLDRFRRFVVEVVERIDE